VVRILNLKSIILIINDDIDLALILSSKKIKMLFGLQLMFHTLTLL